MKKESNPPPPDGLKRPPPPPAPPSKRVSGHERVVICPKCERQWNGASEQAVSVEWHGECVVCKFTPQGKGSNDGTEAELRLISDESVKRRTGQHMSI